MPADIVIAYKEGQMELESEDGTTIADIIRIRGPGCLLRREDGVMKLSPSIVIKAGNYSWIPAQQPEQENGEKNFGFGSFVYCLFSLYSLTINLPLCVSMGALFVCFHPPPSDVEGCGRKQF